MCRWMAYAGNTIPLETLMFKVEHNLIDQSLSSRMATTPTNGESNWAVRYASDGNAPSLYHSRAVDDLGGLNPQIASTLGQDARGFVSEPIGRFAEIWEEIPTGSALHARAGKIETRPFAPSQ
jgi:predicted glutamine amidotransferase